MQCEVPKDFGRFPFLIPSHCYRWVRRIWVQTETKSFSKMKLTHLQLFTFGYAILCCALFYWFYPFVAGLFFLFLLTTYEWRTLSMIPQVTPEDTSNPVPKKISNRVSAFFSGVLYPKRGPKYPIISFLIM